MAEQTGSGNPLGVYVGGTAYFWNNRVGVGRKITSLTLKGNELTVQFEIPGEGDGREFTMTLQDKHHVALEQGKGFDLTDDSSLGSENYRPMGIYCIERQVTEVKGPTRIEPDSRDAA